MASRSLTSGETTLLRSVFGAGIDYQRVRNSRRKMGLLSTQ